MKETIIINCPNGAIIVRVKDKEVNKVIVYGRIDGVKLISKE